jgi:hypothetical protein
MREMSKNSGFVGSIQYLTSASRDQDETNAEQKGYACDSDNKR